MNMRCCCNMQSSAVPPDHVLVIETELDDANPQLLAHACERARAVGALDVYLTPLLMKKNRPGVLLTLLCQPEAEDQFCNLLLAETPTLGLRLHLARRVTLERRWVEVTTPWGMVRVKEGWRHGRCLNAAPEFEDCKTRALAAGVPLKEVVQAAIAAYDRIRQAAGQA